MFSVKKNPLITVISAICIVLAILTTFDYSVYNYLQYCTKPKYIWQYLSGAFMHGNSEAPVWFLWVHLGMNLLMIIPLGGLVERKAGIRKTIVLFLVSWFVSSFIFKLLFWNTSETATGISMIGYAFAPSAFYFIFKDKDNIGKKRMAGYIVLLLAMIMMLCPLITGWVSFCLHMSGVVIGSVFIPYCCKNNNIAKSDNYAKL